MLLIEKNDSLASKNDVESDWRDRLKMWRQVSISTGAITNIAAQELSNSVSGSVIGCLQASYSAEQLKSKVEKSMINGLRRTAGLNLLNFAMSLQISD